MELFWYFRIKQGGTISPKLFVSRKHLWNNLEEEEVQEALICK